MKQVQTKIIAHRGASFLAPENTMAAFKLAYQLGSDGIETDVHLTKDHIPVLIHDEYVDRTTNGSAYVRNLTYNQIKSLDAGSWFSEEYKGITICSLDEFLQWAQLKNIYLHIELKNKNIYNRYLEANVLELIKYYKLEGRAILSTFNPNSVKFMSSMYNNQIEIAYLTNKLNLNVITHAQKIGAHALHVKYRLRNFRFIKKCQQINMPIRVFTINKKQQMIRCFKYESDGIITDIPERGIKYRTLFDLK